MQSPTRAAEIAAANEAYTVLKTAAEDVDTVPLGADVRPARLGAGSGGLRCARARGAKTDMSEDTSVDAQKAASHRLIANYHSFGFTTAPFHSLHALSLSRSLPSVSLSVSLYLPSLCTPSTLHLPSIQPSLCTTSTLSLQPIYSLSLLPSAAPPKKSSSAKFSASPTPCATTALRIGRIASQRCIASWR